MAFRALMAITARFDLDTIQMDVINAFVNYKLDETSKGAIQIEEIPLIMAKRADKHL
jgi:hypothetical protein